MGGRAKRAWTLVWKDRRSTASLLLGHEQGVQVFRRVSGWWGSAIGLMTLVLTLSLHLHPVEGANVAGSLVVAVGATGVALGYLLVGERAGERSLIALSLAALIGMVVEVGLVGPRLEMALVVPALACIQALFYLPRRMSVLANSLVVVSYAILVLGFPGYPAPWARLLVFVSVLTATSTVLAWIVGQIEKLSKRERDAQADLAHMTAALATANAQLEELVGRQGEEIGSLQRLRRFVSAQVAEALLADGMEALAPHRSRIAVLFCDLRGFTNFSSTAEPEEVMEVLDEYYAVVGRSLDDNGATVGSFAGDGIMAYFGDPVPCDDPAGTAVRMAVSLMADMQEAVAGWRRRGYDVGCGIGIAYGFATLGSVGVEGRTDYTALGPTVNLASRLCDLARDGELLIDGRTHAAVEGRVVGEAQMREVKGFPLPVHVLQVTSWTESSAPAPLAMDSSR